MKIGSFRNTSIGALLLLLVATIHPASGMDFRRRNILTGDSGQLVQSLPAAALPDLGVDDRYASFAPGVNKVMHAAIDRYLIEAGLLRTSDPEPLRAPVRRRFIQVNRPSARALAFAGLLEAITLPMFGGEALPKPLQIAPTDAVAARRFMLDLMQVRLTVQTGVALAEYKRWKEGGCDQYSAPQGDYPAYKLDECSPPPGLLSLFWLGPSAPRVRDYGSIAAWGAPESGGPEALMHAVNAATVLAASGSSGALAKTTALGARVYLSLLPFSMLEGAMYSQVDPDTGEKIGRDKLGRLGFRAAGLGVSGPAAIITFGAQILIETALRVAAAEKLEGKLVRAFEAAQVQEPDLLRLSRSEKGLLQMYSAFVDTTIWYGPVGLDLPDNYPLPSPPPLNGTAGATLFGALNYFSPIEQAMRSFELKIADWSGEAQTVYQVDGWFVVSKGGGAPQFTTEVRMKNWAGLPCILSHRPGGFLVIAADGSYGALTPMLRYTAPANSQPLQVAWRWKEFTPKYTNHTLFFKTTDQDGRNAQTNQSFTFVDWNNVTQRATYSGNGKFTISGATGTTTTNVIQFLAYNSQRVMLTLDFDGTTFLQRAENSNTVAQYHVAFMRGDSRKRDEYTKVKLVVPGSGPIPMDITVGSKTTQALEFSYISWDGKPWNVRFQNGQFVHRNNETGAEHSDAVINYKSWEGVNWSATVAPGSNQLLGTPFFHRQQGSSAIHSEKYMKLILGNGVKATITPVLPEQPETF